MSFSKDVKAELCKLKDQERTPSPVLAGLFAHSRLSLEGKLGVRSESQKVPELCARLMSRKHGEKWPIWAENDRLYICALEESETQFQIPENYFMPGEEALFVRGAFLSCGTISEPMRAYDLGFSLVDDMPINVLLKAMEETPFPFRVVDLEGEGKRLYLKDSTSIEEFLIWIGAHQSALSLMETKIYKELRNQANRVNNFDTSNIEKAAVTGTDQAALIEQLKQNGHWNNLPDDLKKIGELRQQYPEVSLAELGALCEPPLSRSSVFRRMEKIKKMADVSDPKNQKGKKE